MAYKVDVMNAKCNPLILLSKLSWLVFKAFCIIKTNMSLSYVFLCQKVISCEDKLPDLIFDIMMMFLYSCSYFRFVCVFFPLLCRRQKIQQLLLLVQHLLHPRITQTLHSENILLCGISIYRIKVLSLPRHKREISPHYE